MKSNKALKLTSDLALKGGEPFPPAILKPSPFWSRIKVVWTLTVINESPVDSIVCEGSQLFFICKQNHIFLFLIKKIYYVFFKFLHKWRNFCIMNFPNFGFVKTDLFQTTYVSKCIIKVLNSENFCQEMETLVLL